MMTRTFALAFAAMLGLAGAAHAEIPAFSASCPQGHAVESDGSGAIRVDGAPASVRAFNANYHEATHDGVTYTISFEDDGGDLLVGYNPPGNAGGFCTVQGASAGDPERLGGHETHAARKACREALRERAGRGGISISSAEFSEANTLVMLAKKGAGEWRCLSSNDGEVAELTQVGGRSTAAGASAAETDCIAAVGEMVGGTAGLSVRSAEMGETFTKVVVDVPQAEQPWACEWGGAGVQRVYYMGEG